jgi:AraC family transcriptional regulator of adaptative response/methylated-DNA-[protein]-cysteine methyltransferase
MNRSANKVIWIIVFGLAAIVGRIKNFIVSRRSKKPTGALHNVKFYSRIDKPSQRLNLPLDIQGTAFQCQVWQALREIPFGSTASYADIAEKIGKPKAARVVAKACASNKLAIAIPCHRVVRKNGELGGYRWGTEKKHKVLEREIG